MKTGRCRIGPLPGAMDISFIEAWFFAPVRQPREREFADQRASVKSNAALFAGIDACLSFRNSLISEIESARAMTGLIVYRYRELVLGTLQRSEGRPHMRLVRRRVADKDAGC